MYRDSQLYFSQLALPLLVALKILTGVSQLLVPFEFYSDVTVTRNSNVASVTRYNSKM